MDAHDSSWRIINIHAIHENLKRSQTECNVFLISVHESARTKYVRVSGFWWLLVDFQDFLRSYQRPISLKLMDKVVSQKCWLWACCHSQENSPDWILAEFLGLPGHVKKSPAVYTTNPIKQFIEHSMGILHWSSQWSNLQSHDEQLLPERSTQSLWAPKARPIARWD